MFSCGCSRMFCGCLHRLCRKDRTMYLDDPKTRKTLTKWVVGTITACILIFLGIRYVSVIAFAVKWFFELVKPLVIGIVIAMILSVPQSFLEQRLLQRKPTPRREKWKRPLSILLSVLLVIGIFAGVAVLVIPELIGAVSIVVRSVTDGMDQLAALESSGDLSALPFAQTLAELQIDWIALKKQLVNWVEQLSTTILNASADMLGKAASSLLDLVLGIVFALYILSNREKLLRQLSRLACAWLPDRFTNTIWHICSVSYGIFRQFIVGQTTEAVILGTLCGVGMAILRIPYAPMVGALVGVTALIPYVGAFIATFVGAFMILTVNPFKALVFILYLLTLQQVEGNLIYPKVVGAKINLPPMWVLAAITVGGNLAGPIGMLLGVPAASAAYALLKEATINRERKKEYHDQYGHNQGSTRDRLYP